MSADFRLDDAVLPARRWTRADVIGDDNAAAGLHGRQVVFGIVCLEKILVAGAGFEPAAFRL
jgi:hypothetical protein